MDEHTCATFDVHQGFRTGFDPQPVEEKNKNPMRGGARAAGGLPALGDQLRGASRRPAVCAVGFCGVLRGSVGLVGGSVGGVKKNPVSRKTAGVGVLKTRRPFKQLLFKGKPKEACCVFGDT